jgi:hypothetical protein
MIKAEARELQMPLADQRLSPVQHGDYQTAGKKLDHNMFGPPTEPTDSNNARGIWATNFRDACFSQG